MNSGFSFSADDISPIAAGRNREMLFRAVKGCNPSLYVRHSYIRSHRPRS